MSLIKWVESESLNSWDTPQFKHLLISPFLFKLMSFFPALKVLSRALWVLNCPIHTWGPLGSPRWWPWTVGIPSHYAKVNIYTKSPLFSIVVSVFSPSAHFQEQWLCPKHVARCCMKYNSEGFSSRPDKFVFEFLFSGKAIYPEFILTVDMRGSVEHLVAILNTSST